MIEDSLEQLKAARAKAAQVVTDYGAVYLPIFERLDAEVKAYESLQESLDRVRRTGTHTGTRSGTHAANVFPIANY